MREVSLRAIPIPPMRCKVRSGTLGRIETSGSSPWVRSVPFRLSGFYSFVFVLVRTVKRKEERGWI